MAHIDPLRNINLITSLQSYFQKEPEVILAFLFGSRARKIGGKISDWDVAVYFRPQGHFLEWEETEHRYPDEERIWDGLIDLLKTDEVDLVVLNRAPANIVAAAITEGIPLIIRDRGLFLDLMLVTLRQAEDYRDFVDTFYEISQRSLSLVPKDRERLIRIVDFLEKEVSLFSYFTALTFDDYKDDLHKRHDIERWIENIVNSCIDIGEIILASERKLIPQSYKDVFLDLSVLPQFKKSQVEKFVNFVKLRNILAHDYLDIRWKRIEEFIKGSRPLVEEFLKATKRFISNA